MPCRSDGWEEYDASQRQQKEAKQLADLDLATRLLCVATARLEALGQLDNPELKEWKEAHAKVDKARQQAEQKAALEAELRREQEIQRLEAQLAKLKKQNKR